MVMVENISASSLLSREHSAHPDKASEVSTPDVEKVKVESTESDDTQAVAAASARAATNQLRFWIIFMVMTGGSVDFLADMFNDVVPDVGFGNSAAVFLTTTLSFVASAVPPTLNSADRRSLRDVNRNNRMFKYKVLIPGLADLVITGLRYVAILYISPAIVSILKSSSQLLVLSIIQHFRGKKLTLCLASCLGGAFAGEVVVSVAGSLGGVPGIDPAGPAYWGVIFAIVSGSLGAVRNVFEELLLQGDDLSAGGLLMAESWISLVGTVIANLVYHSDNLQEFLREVAAVCSMGAVWPILITLMLCTYGKDFGKLFVTKFGDALTAKVLSMLFPIITWLLDLVTFAATRGQFGEGLDPVASPLQLAGFIIVACCSITFVIRQKKK